MSSDVVTSSLTAWSEGVSLVIPTHNSEKSLTQLFKHLKTTEIMEVSICDRQSTDATIAVARDNGAHVFRVTAGFSEAVNQVVNHARGTAIWFLAPHCQPPEQAAHYILDALEHPGVVAGYFSVKVIHPTIGRKWQTLKANLRANWQHRALLDHGPFINRFTFGAIGGFPEDGSLLKHAGKKGKIERQPVFIKSDLDMLSC